MNIYRTSSMLKTLARGQLLGKYPTVVGALLTWFMIRGVLTFSSNILVDTRNLLGLFLYYLIFFIISLIMGVFTASEAYLYLKLICNQPVKVSDIFYGFKNQTDKIITVQLYLSLLYYACMLPEIILNQVYLYTGQGTIRTAAYWAMLAGSCIHFFISLYFSQCYYLLLDFPDYDARLLLKTSIEIMNGQKKRLFYVYLSFLPLMLLATISLGFPFLWILPYMNATLANFYIDLMQKKAS